MRIYKKAIKIYLTIVLLIPFMIISIFYYYDPIQIFHKSFITKDLHLHSNMRQQAAGIINNYEFDSIIIGTSMLENTSSIEASEVLGGNFINISLSGSNFYERNIILSYALKKKEINKVIYSLDAFGYFDQTKGDISSLFQTFNFLYDNNPFNDFKVYWNNKFIHCILTFSENDECIGNKTTLEYPNAWFNSEFYSQKFGGIDNWFKLENNEQIKDSFSEIVSTSNKIKKGEVESLNGIEEKIIKAKENINEYLLKNVSNFPNTRFIMIFPPYSRMQYAIWKQQDLPNYEIHKAIIEYITYKSNEYKNLEIYGFEDNDFLDDISNYKDLGHYHQSINSIILNNIRNKIGLLTKNNVNSYIKISEEKAENYNIFEIADKISKYLKDEYIKVSIPTIKKVSIDEITSKNLIFNIKESKYFKNNQLEINSENENIKLNTIKEDPVIILNQTRSNSKNVILNYEINSNMDTVFQLYYIKEINSHYTEQNSYTVFLKKGNNKINLLIPTEYINNNLRVDLVSNIGNFEIKEFQIFEIL